MNPFVEMVREMEEKKFILATRDHRETGRRLVEFGQPWWMGTGGILGNPVSLDNVYVSTYAKYQDKHAKDLKVGESCKADFHLSGENGSYDVVRVA